MWESVTFWKQYKITFLLHACGVMSKSVITTGISVEDAIQYATKMWFSAVKVSQKHYLKFIVHTYDMRSIYWKYL